MNDIRTDSDTPAHAVRDATHVPLGVFSILLGLGAGYRAWEYGIGTVRSMDAGFFPFAVSVILIALGVVLLMRGGADLPAEEMTVPATTPAERHEHLLRIARVLGTVLGGLLVFALMLKPAGLVVAVVVLVGLVSLGHPGPQWRPVLALAIGLAAFAAVVFVVLLKVQIGLWPGILPGGS